MQKDETCWNCISSKSCFNWRND